MGPGRMKALDLKTEAIHHRLKENEGLEEVLAEIASYMAEGKAMSEGVWFASGIDLASYLRDTAATAIAVLMEKGMLSKTLPDKAAKLASGDDEDGHPGHYL